MFESITIGTSALLGHEKGLRTVGNNLANVNTAGFKSSQLGFTALFDQQAGGGQGAAGSNAGSGGSGMAVGGTVVNFQAGQDQSTGNPTDLRINGNGFFVIKRDNEYLYTRAGDFSFNDKGALVNSAGDAVQAMGEGGTLSDLVLDKQLREPGQGHHHPQVRRRDPVAGSRQHGGAGRCHRAQHHRGGRQRHQP